MDHGLPFIKTTIRFHRDRTVYTVWSARHPVTAKENSTQYARGPPIEINISTVGGKQSIGTQCNCLALSRRLMAGIASNLLTLPFMLVRHANKLHFPRYFSTEISSNASHSSIVDLRVNFFCTASTWCATSRGFYSH